MASRADSITFQALRHGAETVGRDTGARLIVVFGSVARPDDAGGRAPEDIDLGVLYDGVPDLVDVTNRFIRVLHFQAVDVVDLRRADPLLLMLVAQDGIPLYEREGGGGGGGEFNRFASLAARRYADTRKFRVAERDEIRDFVRRSRPR